jgi:hypothetical protein
MDLLLGRYDTCFGCWLLAAGDGNQLKDVPISNDRRYHPSTALATLLDRLLFPLRRTGRIISSAYSTLQGSKIIWKEAIALGAAYVPRLGGERLEPLKDVPYCHSKQLSCGHSWLTKNHGLQILQLSSEPYCNQSLLQALSILHSFQT